MLTRRVFFSALSSIQLLHGQSPPPRLFIDGPVDVHIPTPPAAFRGGGKTHLVYELHVTNAGRGLIAIEAIEVQTDREEPLAKMTGEPLIASILSLQTGPAKPGFKLAAGVRAVVFLWVTLENGAKTPASIQHRVSIATEQTGQTFSMRCGQASVRQDSVIIGPPLEGSNWIAGNGPSNTSQHRRAMLPVGGNLHIAQRFAIDWIQVDKNVTHRGDPLINKNYFCYDAKTLAVANGTIAQIKDGIPENVPDLVARAVPMTLETGLGNHVILDLGSGRYAAYAHLQPGSLRVRPGQKVKRGDVLGLVGNSGNSTEPHLHFHVSDSISPLGSEGLPFAFAGYEGGGVRRKGESPLEDEPVSFTG